MLLTGRMLGEGVENLYLVWNISPFRGHGAVTLSGQRLGANQILAPEFSMDLKCQKGEGGWGKREGGRGRETSFVKGIGFLLFPGHPCTLGSHLPH